VPPKPSRGENNIAQSTRRHSINRVFMVLATIFSIRYFYWRAHATMVPAAKWFFYLFLAAELLSFLETVLFYFTAWKSTCHPSRPPLPNRTVDVLIATYNEPVGLLRDTVVCAMGMTYPHTTYLLDDGNRAEVRALAHDLSCEYIARTDRTHAKAGNLNNALKRTRGEFIVTLDADHVPMPDMIEKLIGFFADPAVAIVQSSQDFYNLDSFQHVTQGQDTYVWQQQELFFSVIQPGKDAYNAAFYCGSPAMCRRSALEEIGGFATETITEDMHTGLRLQKKGKKVLYYNKTVAWGLAPQTFGGFVTQWRRWGHGAFQVLRCENPLFSKGLTAAQRICYFSSFYFYWMSYQKLVYIMTPIFCLVTGIFPLATQPGTFARYFLPYLGLNLLATANLQGGMIAFLLSEQFNVVKLSALLGSPKGLFHSNSKFSVTPKSRASGARWSQVWLQLTLLAGILAALVVGLWRIHDPASRFQLWALGVNVCWGIFFVFLTAPIIRKALARAEYRRAYRFPTGLDVPLMIAFTPAGGQHKNLQTHARSLNRFGLAFTSDNAIALGTKIGINFQLTGHNVYARGIVVRSREIQFAGKKLVENGIHFEYIDPKNQDAIAKYLFWEVAPRHGRRMQLTYERQNQQPALVLPEISPSGFGDMGIAITDFAMKGEPVRPFGSK
jgi:cellulose synthase (UDP-forming)